MEVTIAGILTLLAISILGMGAFLLMLWLPLWFLGVELDDVLEEITLPEGVFFGLYAFGCAHLVGALFSRFV